MCKGDLIKNCVEIEFKNHMEGKKKEVMVLGSQVDLSVSQKVIKTIAASVRRMGPTFIEGKIKGEIRSGEKSQLIIAPLVIAPRAKFRVGVINGEPFSNLILGAG